MLWIAFMIWFTTDGTPLVRAVPRVNGTVRPTLAAAVMTPLPDNSRVKGIDLPVAGGDVVELQVCSGPAAASCSDWSNAKVIPPPTPTLAPPSVL